MTSPLRSLHCVRVLTFCYVIPICALRLLCRVMPVRILTIGRTRRKSPSTARHSSASTLAYEDTTHCDTDRSNRIIHNHVGVTWVRDLMWRAKVLCPIGVRWVSLQCRSYSSCVVRTYPRRGEWCGSLSSVGLALRRRHFYLCRIV